MRESPVFEVHLRRFGVWRCMVGASALTALAAVLAWAIATAASRGDDGIGAVVSIAGLERNWQALRCAVYSPPRPAGTAAALASLPPE